MPVKRRRVTRKTRRRTRRKMVAPVRMSRVPILRVKRTFYQGAWVFGTASTGEFWRYNTYTFGALPSVSEFTNMFDEYKLSAIKVTFRPRYDSVSINSVVDGTSQPNITQPQAYAHVIVDPASTTLPSGIYNNGTLNTFLENGGIKTYTLNRPFSVYFRPKVRTSANGGSSASVVQSSPWLRTSDTGVVHNGFHMFLQQNDFSIGANYIRLDTFVTYYFQVKSMR